MVTLSELPLAPKHAVEDVWKYPRPPALQRCPNHLQVIWYANDGTQTTIADTHDALRVLETSHPPTYYLPPASLQVPLSQTAKHSFCEWKGTASYHTFTPPGGKGAVENRIWSYARPTSGFTPLANYLSFYASGQSAAGHWKCFVDGEQVGVQEGDFYGGWITDNIKGPGTWGW